MKLYFPNTPFTDIAKDILEYRKAKIRVRLERIATLLEKDITSQLNQYDGLIMDFFKPLNFNPADPTGYIPTTDKQFSELVLQLEERNPNVIDFTIFRLYSLIEVIKKENKAKENKKLFS